MTLDYLVTVTFDIKDISVGIVNTVRNKTDELRERFGHIIVE